MRLGSVGAALVLTLVACDAQEPPQSRPERTPAPPSTPAETPTPTVAERHPDWLLPNMRSIAASDIQVERVGDRRRLRFAASLANVGDGPMYVVPVGRAGCPAGQIRVRQEIHVDGNGDRVFQRRRDASRVRRAAGCMLDHPTHDHWHLDAMASYTLHLPDGERLSAQDKVSFCLRDNRRAPGSPRVVAKEHFGECSRTTSQGISPGWVDVYRADLDGQSVALPRRVRRQTICLTLAADPFDLLVETDETDNATTIALRVTGQRVRRVPGGC